MLFMCLTGVVHLWAAAAYIKSNPQGITTLAFSSTLAGKPAGLALKAPAPSFRSNQNLVSLSRGAPHGPNVVASRSPVATAATALPLPVLPKALSIPPAVAAALANLTPIMATALCLGSAMVVYVCATSHWLRRSAKAVVRSLGSAARSVTSVPLFTGPLLALSLKEKAKEVAENIVEEEVKEKLESKKVDKKDVEELSDLIYKTEVALEGKEALDEQQQRLGDELEQGWQKRGSGSAFRRNVEIWRFALRCVFKVLGVNKANKKGDKTEEEISAMKTAAAEFIRDGLLKLGPTFVKLGQVVSTRTDIFSKEYIEVLKTLQAEVPGFSGAKAKSIVEEELGKPIDELFQSFSPEPFAAASLGQVHKAVTKSGAVVAVKVQRAGLKELFDVDLKNLKKLAELLDKFDPKSDGADRCWAEIYDESAILLYEEIDYCNEAKNAKRFADQFKGDSMIKIPKVFDDYTTPRVMTMEFVESFKLTDMAAVEGAGLDKKAVAKKTADAFLFQILNTGYFHCDPHPGNLCTNAQGQLVFYDYGMMAQLKPNVLEGFREFCFALFDGGPLISDIELGRNARKLAAAVEKMGVLAKGADRLAVEKLARFFMRSFKDVQLGKSTGNIKEILGDDLKALTNEQVFRFPSTFTFIFRAFASIEGIGKALDPKYDITQLAQPFIETLIVDKGGSKTKLESLGKLTGLNAKDVNVAVTSPRRIAYIEETLRDMEQGNLKIRVRSLENEKSLDRISLQQGIQNQMLIGSMCLNFGLVAFLAELPFLAFGAYGAAALFGVKALGGAVKVKAFDKKQAKYETKSFNTA
jgi:predicted unusual protein kinase regulating ubiquinone biosynthesis (AarF/ABC1/UbiB family)